MENAGKDSSNKQETMTTLSALQVVAKHTEGQEIVRLREENLKLQTMLNGLEAQMEEKHDFYEYLVRSARRRQGFPDNYALLSTGEAFRQNYGDRKFAALQQAKLKLSDPDTGDWTHGFNSGVLAAVRLAWGLSIIEDQNVCQGHEEQQRQCVIDEFPCLDMTPVFGSGDQSLQTTDSNESTR